MSLVTERMSKATKLGLVGQVESGLALFDEHGGFTPDSQINARTAAATRNDGR